MVIAVFMLLILLDPTSLCKHLWEFFLDGTHKSLAICKAKAAYKSFRRRHVQSALHPSVGIAASHDPPPPQQVKDLACHGASPPGLEIPGGELQNQRGLALGTCRLGTHGSRPYREKLEKPPSAAILLSISDTVRISRSGSSTAERRRGGHVPHPVSRAIQ